MASTNKTPNFDLSQYIGSDKPTYLGDYNSDMSKIDTAMATNKTNSENAVTVATGANETASNAQTIATQAQTTAQQANTLAQTAKTAADTAQAGVDENNEAISEFNLTQFSTISNTQMTTDHGNLSTDSSISIAVNSNNTLAKIYGRVSVQNPSYNGTVNVKMNTPLRPTEKMTISVAGIRVVYQSGINGVYGNSIILDTNGKLTIPISSSQNVNNVDAIIFPCLYWLKSFGDTQLES